jgi:muramoyltetrapeptide carboxypeptidase
MMINLKRSGKLHDLAGLIVGGMTDMTDNAVPFGKAAEEIIAEHVAGYNYPVCFNFPAGHIANNQAIVLGKMTNIKVGDTVTVR